MEANEEKRAEYIELIKDIPVEQIVYLDESGIEMSICKERSWSVKGKPTQATRSGKHYERTNIIAGLVCNKPIAPMVFNGSCNSNLFETWTEEFLIKELKQGQIVIMDNASFHKSQRTKDLIESVGCKIIFLPPYSPDFNPIEKFWANMKRWIRQQINRFCNLFDALSTFFNAPNST